MSSAATQSVKRPPIVAILGHVDHGKTTLLDWIKKSRIAQKEPGGITQSIGAYQVDVHGKPITFIDTPGHAAFANMRRYGASAADIVVLVVAADDGVMPQTIQALDIIKDAKTPFIVAINKVDVASADVTKVQSQLLEHGCAVEGFGGIVPVAQISAKKGTGIPDLLELINLLWELEETKPDSDTQLCAPVIESKRDARRGITVSVVVRSGSIAVGDVMYAHGKIGKVKAILNDQGASVPQAHPGDPVQIMGFKDVVPTGTVIRNQPDERQRSVSTGVHHARLTESSLGSTQQPVVIKADAQGTLEALEVSMPPQTTIVSSGIGDISENDVLLGESTKAMIVGFRVKLLNAASELATVHKVPIITNNIIYQLLEELDLQKNKQPSTEILGTALVAKLFVVEKLEIAGCTVLSGKLSVGDWIALVPDTTPFQQPSPSTRAGLIKVATIKQLKTGKTDVKSVNAGGACGVLLAAVDREKLKLSVGNGIISFTQSYE